jgi:hypothetical protein
MIEKQIGKLILAIGFFISSVPLSAQMVTASFDPTQAVFLPAAAGWRENAVAGFAYSEANGNRIVDDKEVYKFNRSGIRANVHGKFSNISVEAAIEQQKTDVKGEYLVDGWINLDRDSGRLLIAMSGNDFVSVGLGGHTNSHTDYYDASHDSESTDQTDVLGSISVKVMDMFYLGGGFGRIKEQSSYTVDNNWNYAALGVAAIFGQPGETRFRVEYSYASSPEAESDGQGDMGTAIHHETNTSRLAAELMMSGLLFSLNGKQKIIRFDEYVVHNQLGYKRIKQTSSEAGVLWVPEDGLTLGFYFGSSETEFYFEDKLTEFRVNIAYVFQ